MEKKIIFGSIIAVAVLIGVSFTSVVGFQSVKPDAKASPLFTVRAKRAIDEESKDLTCDYVGKGEPIQIVIPKISMVQFWVNKVIKIIEKNKHDIGKFDIERYMSIIENNPCLTYSFPIFFWDFTLCISHHTIPLHTLFYF